MPPQDSTTPTGPTWFQQAFGYTDKENNVQHNGWAPTAISGLGGLAQSWLGFKNYGLAKDQFAFQKDAFNKQYNMQAQNINTQYMDRQNARLGAAPGAYQSVGDYMQMHGARGIDGQMPAHQVVPQSPQQSNYQPLPGGRMS